MCCDQSTRLHMRMESTMCHICNTLVPKQFIREHNMSVKHKIYMEIANTALKRIKDKILNDNNNETIQVNESFSFCHHCVSVVNIKEMKNHENSLNHKNSVFLDQRLSDFLNIYSNDIEIACNDVVACNADIVVEESNEMLASNESFKPTNLKDGITSLDLTSYLNSLKDNYKMTTKVKVINEGLLEIEIEGSRFKVAALNFLGLKEASVSSSSIECVVCLGNVKYEDIVSHVMGSKHMYRVSTPMQDIHCKREIYPFWHNCVLCNVIIANYNFHKMSDADHQRRLEEALVVDAIEVAIENCTVSTNDFTLVSNESNKTDATNEHSNNITSKYEYIFKIETGTSRCIVCDVAVHEEDSFEKHIFLDDHIKKYKELLAKNTLQLQYNNDLYCRLCKVVVITNSELVHVTDTTHKQHLRDSEKRINLTKAMSYYCDDCGVTVPNNDYNIQSHNEGRLHLKNVSRFSNKRRYVQKKY